MQVTERERQLMIAYLIHKCVIVALMEELGTKWIYHDVKMAFNTLDTRFNARHGADLKRMFDLKTDDTENSGDAFLSALSATQSLVDCFSKLPISDYPNIINLIEAYKNGQVKEEV